MDPASIDILLVTQYVFKKRRRNNVHINKTLLYFFSFHVDHAASVPYIMERVRNRNIESYSIGLNFE